MKFLVTRILPPVLCAAAALALSSCGTTMQSGPQTSFKFDPPLKQPQNASNVRVKLSTSAQRLYLVEGNEVLLATPICVGTASARTPQGTFRIRAKTAQRRRASSPGAGYPMTYWMEFYSASYGMHWGFVKPYPATHGCVRMPLNSARKVFNTVRVGTPIDVATSQPWDATIGKSLPVLDDSSLPDPPMSYMLSPKVFSDAQQGKMWNF
ncbi:L,D-transpeptidase [Luteolibacter marinus]|uniref:L,D-transpeptidase n=1 Tax=Luteolibacter marinus TaxID=2776705 RepID=UPI001866DD3C|nr:L,D-transpeptidase [Luteolibacter marinus]